MTAHMLIIKEKKRQLFKNSVTEAIFGMLGLLIAVYEVMLRVMVV